MNDELLILAVHHNQQNLHMFTTFLVKEHYTTHTVKNLEEFDQALMGQTLFCLALIDITGFDGHIWSRCRQLHEKNIPFIIISPKQSAIIQHSGLEHDARNILIKPLVIIELLIVIHSLLGG